MKKFLLLAIIFFLGFNIKAENSVELNSTQNEKVTKYVLNKMNKKLFNLKPNSKNHNEVFKNSIENSLQSQMTKMAIDSLIFDMRALMGDDAMFKFTLKYDNYSNIIEDDTYEGYNPETQSFILTEKTRMTYNSQNLMADEITEYFDEEMKNWYFGEKYNYYYDNNNELVEMTVANYYDTEWIVENKTTYKYDENGNLIEENEYYVYEDEIELSDKTEYIYNSSNQIIEEISYSYFMDEMYTTGKITYEYDNNNLIEKRIYEYSAENEEFNDINYTAYNYNENNYRETTESFYFDNGSQEWVVESKTDYIYDENGNVIEEIEYGESELTGEYGPNIKTEYTYDYDYSVDDLLLPESDEEDGLFIFGLKNMPLKTKLFLNFPVVGWTELGVGMDFFFSEKQFQVFGSVEPISKSKINIFPNPTTDILNIELENNGINSSIDIMDLQGKVLYSKELSNTNVVNVKELKTGTYIFLIKDNGNLFGGKFIKE